MGKSADTTPQPPNDLDTQQTQLALRVEKLELESFRGFRSLTIEMPAEGPAVFIGINGCGKSSILDAIAVSLRIGAAYAIDHVLSPPRLGIGSDIQEGRKTAKIALSIHINDKVERWIAQIRDVSLGMVDDLTLHEFELRKALNVSTTTRFPVLCHYPATRGMRNKMSDEETATANALEFPQLAAYWGAFDDGVGPFRDFVQWFRDEEDAENEARLRIDNAHRNPRLEVVRRALQQFLQELNGAHYTNMRMERLGRRAKKTAELVIDKNGVRLSIAQLSEGEKNTLLMIADLASRLGMANPGAGDPLLGNGVVLIDEVDLHLHPAWQRELMPALGKTFPGVQFIVTTHSPQVLGRVPKNNVFILEDFHLVQNRPHTYGRDANSILGEIMGVPERPKDVEDLIRTASRLVDEERLDEARTALKKLAAVVGDEDQMVLRIRTLMSFLRSEGSSDAND